MADYDRTDNEKVFYETKDSSERDYEHAAAVDENGPVEFAEKAELRYLR